MNDINNKIINALNDALNRLNIDYDPDKIVLDRPKQTDHGEWSTNIAMQLASDLKKAPRNIAEDIKAALQLDSSTIEKVEIAGPGFINFYLGWGYFRDVIKDVLKKGRNFGQSNLGKNGPIQVEFVSANPTGPLNVVSARAAAVGDVMANLYNQIGFKADREFYVNDAGRQIRLLGESVSARYLERYDQDAQFPEDGYRGEYVIDLAEGTSAEHGEKFVNTTREERVRELAKIALEKMIAHQKEIMNQYRVDFQNWFRESQLRDNNEHLKVLDKLKKDGFTYEQDGAIWFRSTKFGDEKNRVLITSEGEPTYFLVDIAYHQNKYQRGYKKVYDIWGPDHHGYIQRMKAAILALGYPEESFHVEIVQQVNLLRGGEVIKMSKRAGQIIEMKEVIDEVGVDAARFFFVNRKCSSHLDFDIDLAKKQTEENPVYYVQYAHARICNILKYAEENNLTFDESANLDLIKENEEKLLIKKILEYPDIIIGAAKNWEPHRLTNYLQELAATFHHFYHLHRVVSDDRDLSRARLMLTKATQIVLANGFKILGITAPEYM